MYSPSTIGAERSQISASAAIDYTKPFQLRGQIIREIPRNYQFATDGSWRSKTSVYNIPTDIDTTSFRISAYAADNWGTPFQVWVSILNENTGSYLYDSGFVDGGITNDVVSMASDVSQIRIYIRFRYADDTLNPPTNSVFQGAQWTITYDRYYQISQETNIPDSWYSTTTAENTPIIDTSTTVVEVPDDITTTVAPETVDEYLTLPAKVHSALLFMLSIVGRLLQLKYVTPAICFGLLVALAGWLLH